MLSSSLPPCLKPASSPTASDDPKARVNANMAKVGPRQRMSVYNI